MKDLIRGIAVYGLVGAVFLAPAIAVHHILNHFGLDDSWATIFSLFGLIN